MKRFLAQLCTTAIGFLEVVSTFQKTCEDHTTGRHGRRYMRFRITETEVAALLRHCSDWATAS